MLSKKLFTHGVYKVQSTPSEFNIYLLPEKRNRYRSEQVNPNFQIHNEEQNNNNTFDLETEYNNIISNISSDYRI